MLHTKESGWQKSRNVRRKENDMGFYETQEANYEYRKDIKEAYNRGYEQGKADSAPKWIPVTADTLPKEGKVVVVCGEGGTWDFGTYRGHLSSANKWNWKKNTVKTVYWWMYKEDALPEPYKGE
jgi:hypothetical protein